MAKQEVEVPDQESTDIEDVEELEEAITTARDEAVNKTSDYLLGIPLLADYLEEGLEKLQAASVEDLASIHEIGDAIAESVPKRVFIVHSYEIDHVCGRPQHDGVIQ